MIASSLVLPGGYVWLPRYDGTQVWNGDPRNDLTSAWQAALLAGVLAIPPVAAACGLEPLVAASLVGSHSLRMLAQAPVASFFRRRPRWLEARFIVDLVHGVGLIAALVVATGDPLTPLWALAPLYASLDGSDFDFPPIVAYVGLHSATPLVTIPFFIGAGAPIEEAIAAPMFFALACFMAYQYGASRKVVVRAAFAERDALRDRLAHEREAAERRRLGRVLTDSIAARLERARSARNDAEVATAAREGLGELRAMLGALEAPARSIEAAPRSPTYRLLPSFSEDAHWNRARANGLVAAALSAPVAVALSVPAVASVFGLRAAIAGPVTALFPVWTLVWAGAPDAVRRSVAGTRVFYLGSIALATTIALALPVSSGDPSSALWALAVIYASFNGADHEVEASWVHVFFHAIAPLATIPAFIALDAPLATSIGMPILFAVICWIAYSFNATRSHVVREARAERERLAAELAAERTARARERLARDLHDSVGASLSLASIYADLLAKAGGAEAAARLKKGFADAAEQSLDDLRKLLESLEREAGIEGDLTEIVQARAERLAGAAEVEVSVRASGSANVGAAARFAVLRIADEAIANALRHAHARRIDVDIACDPREVRVAVADDGQGIRADDRHGYGLRNMRARAEELGGTLVVSSGPGGTRIRVSIPSPSRA